MKLINGWDTEKGICVVEKKDNKRVLTYIDNVIWYFYMLTEDIETHSSVLNEYKQKGFILEIEVSNTTRYSRVFAKRIRDDVNYKEFEEECYEREIELFEYDLSKAKRYIIDNKIDIETD